MPPSPSKRSSITSPKQVSEDDVKKIEELEKLAAVKREYAEMADRDKLICKNQIERFEQMQDKIQKFKSGREALPKDSDGIYFIVSGQAGIRN